MYLYIPYPILALLQEKERRRVCSHASSYSSSSFSCFYFSTLGSFRQIKFYQSPLVVVVIITHMYSQVHFNIQIVPVAVPITNFQIFLRNDPCLVQPYSCGTCHRGNSIMVYLYKSPYFWCYEFDCY